MKNIGKNIKKFRFVVGKSQQDMANILGISQRTYAWWESGKDIPLGKLAPLKEEYPELDMNWLLTEKVRCI